MVGVAVIVIVLVVTTVGAIVVKGVVVQKQRQLIEWNLRGLQEQYNHSQTLLSVRHGVYNSILGKLRIKATGFTSIDEQDSTCEL